MIKRIPYIFLTVALIYIISYFYKDIFQNLSQYRDITQHPTAYFTSPGKSFVVAPSIIVPSPTPIIIKKNQTKNSETTQIKQSAHPQEDWGVAKDIGDGTYTIRVESDSAMGTPQEVFEALNHYRNVNGSSTLTWDDRLASYAQSRADYMASIQTTDKHAGFNNFVENEDGFAKLGYYSLGENSYFGGPLNGVHLIEWVFAKSPGHDANQKDNSWSHVGIGVTNSTVNLNFGGNKM